MQFQSRGLQGQLMLVYSRVSQLAIYINPYEKALGATRESNRLVRSVSSLLSCHSLMDVRKREGNERATSNSRLMIKHPLKHDTFFLLFFVAYSRNFALEFHTRMAT